MRRNRMSHYMHRQVRPEVLKYRIPYTEPGHEMPLPQLRHMRWHSKNAVNSPWLSFLYSTSCPVLDIRGLWLLVLYPTGLQGLLTIDSIVPDRNLDARRYSVDVTRVSHWEVSASMKCLSRLGSPDQAVRIWQKGQKGWVDVGGFERYTMPRQIAYCHKRNDNLRRRNS